MIDRKSRLAQLDLPLPVHNTRSTPFKYQLTVGGNTYYWTGRGRLPLVFDQYLDQHRHLGSREQLLQGLLIQAPVQEVAA
ncbi:MAG: hypothetical protein WAQ53_10650 [Thiofilum sp.]|uniref:hypothetical protein n=1 Tax=Thiofilum sp. TaxID=2212733 RepID=UPI0025EA31EA|nr:hypothetical protein [Thiofilum sp.]MBK8453320.1 hypothetical protein [Thiofilum sp.]